MNFVLIDINLSLFFCLYYYSTIGVLLFENIFNPPIITGLPDFDVHYNEMNVEEKNELLRPKNLNMICPKVMKLTSITIELVKILKNYRLVDLILNIIRNNLLNKRTNINFKIVSKTFSRNYVTLLKVE